MMIEARVFYYVPNHLKFNIYNENQTISILLKSPQSNSIMFESGSY